MGLPEAICTMIYQEVTSEINVREDRRDNQEWTIQRHWQHLGTQDVDKQKHDIENKTDKQHVPHQISGVNPGVREG